MADSTREVSEVPAAEAHVEELALALARSLRGLRNRQELTDYAVSILRESNEEAQQEEQAEEGKERARSDPFNPIAFAIPLFLVGAVLSMTGLLIGPGLGIIGVALLMVFYGLAVALVRRR